MLVMFSTILQSLFTRQTGNAKTVWPVTSCAQLCMFPARISNAPGKIGITLFNRLQRFPRTSRHLTAMFVPRMDTCCRRPVCRRTRRRVSGRQRRQHQHRRRRMQADSRRRRTGTCCLFRPRRHHSAATSRLQSIDAEEGRRRRR